MGWKESTRRKERSERFSLKAKLQGGGGDATTVLDTAAALQVTPSAELSCASPLDFEPVMSKRPHLRA